MMRRHVIVGRFGPGDNERIATAPDEVSTRLDLVLSKKRLDHGLGRALDDLSDLKLYPSEVGLDLLVLAAHVHAADTRVSRKSEAQDSWTREIRLVVPVSDLATWSAAAPLVKRTLDFLTGDKWTIDFRARPARFASAVPTRPLNLNPAPFDSISLFSGGLDSLIGAIDLLEGGRTPLLVSHAGEGAVSASQAELFDGLKSQYPRNHFDRLRIWMAFPKGLVRGVVQEDTTRSRSFLFFAAGVFAGTGTGGRFTLRVPENGLIALNVPLDPLRLGSLSTKTTHPFYMARWNDLLAALRINGVVENPYWDKTKGEMVGQCANRRFLAGVVESSMSCASPTKGRWQGHGTQHCGYCLPCLIRRAALLAGLGVADPTTYTIPNLRARALDTKKAEGEQIRSFQVSIERLRSNPALASILINKPGPLVDMSAAQRAGLAGVYRRGLTEVGQLLTGVRARPL